MLSLVRNANASYTIMIVMLLCLMTLFMESRSRLLSKLATKTVLTTPVLHVLHENMESIRSVGSVVTLCFTVIKL